MALNFSRQLYSPRVVQALRTKTSLLDIASRVRYTGEPARGAVLNIMAPNGVTTGSTLAGPISFADAAGVATSITMNLVTTADVEVLAAQSVAISEADMVALVDSYIMDEAAAMAIDIDTALAALNSSADLTATFGTALSASNILDAIGTVRDTLEEAGALRNGAWVCFPSAFGGFLFNALGGRQQLLDGQVRDGLVTRIMGIDVYTSPVLSTGATPVHTLFAGQYGAIGAAYALDSLNVGPLWPATRGYGISSAIAYGIAAIQPGALFAATITK
jgi:hypothetical protein